MRHSISYFLFIIAITLQIVACKTSNTKQTGREYDPELETPDIDDAGMSHGYNLTKLGCFVYRPWQYDLTNDSLYNMRVTLQDSEIYSKGYKYSSEEGTLFFLLTKDNSLKYWIKDDYTLSNVDTLKGGIIIKHNIPFDRTKVKNMYSGNWKFNQTDSSFIFNFNDSKKPLPNIQGKYIQLDNSLMSYQNSFYFDSTIDGNLIKLKKIITKYLTH